MLSVNNFNNAVCKQTLSVNCKPCVLAKGSVDALAGQAIQQQVNRNKTPKMAGKLCGIKCLKTIFLNIIQIDTPLEDIRQVHHAYSQLRLTANTS